MRYDLVFEGGGARGVVFVGALEALQAAGHTTGRLLGTSAGAIVATLLAAGYTPAEMREALNETIHGTPVFQTFLAPPPPFAADEIQNSALRSFFRDLDWAFVPESVEDKLDDALTEMLLRFPVHRNLMAYLERGGWFAGEPFNRWLTGKLESGEFQGKPRAFGQMTLRQFHEVTDAELSMVVTDTSAARMRVLNHRTAPDCPLVWAVRMSMNLPFVWPDIHWEQSWGMYLGGKLTGNVMLDGGILSGFPLELFVSNEPFVQALMGKASGNPLLGLLIDETLRVSNDPYQGVAPPPSGLDLTSLRAVERITRLVNTMTSARDTMVLEAFEESVVRLPARGYGTIEFDMSDARRDLLVESGRAAMARWLEKASPAGKVESARAASIAAINQRAMAIFSE